MNHCRVSELALCIPIVVALCHPGQALADEREPSETVRVLKRDPDRPWAKGVPSTAQDRADRLFQAGNELLLKESYAAAAVKYKQALKAWKHPAISYNLSLALNELEQWVDMYHALEHSMAFDVPGLGEPIFFERAQKSFESVARKVAIMTVVCNDAGARVTLNGREMFVGPGSFRKVVLPGEHYIRATRQGRLPAEENLVLAAGERKQVELELFIEVTTKTYPRSRWWEGSLLIGGVAMLATGLVFNLVARAGFSRFDEEFDTLCIRGLDDTGCFDSDLSPGLLGRLDTSADQRLGAYIGYGLGGAAIAASVALWRLNKPRVTKKKVRPRDDDVARSLLIEPTLHRAGLGVSAQLQF